MRIIKLILLALIAITLIIIAFANREMVTLTLLPAELAVFYGDNVSVELPLYAAVLAGVAIGLLLGFIWEWIREGKHRSAAVSERREKAMLASENKKLKAEKNADKDEILVLLEESVPAR